MSDPGDNELLAAARAGDRAALEALLARHQARIFRFGMKMCRDPEDAADVLQETMLAVARGVGDFRGTSSLPTWLYTIARSFCIKKRRRPVPAQGEAGLDVADPARSPEESVAGRQIERALEEAIRSLEPAVREVLVLRDVEGLSAAEVAEVLGLSVQAVKSRLHRARLAVRERVAPVLGIREEAPGSTCPDVLTLFSRHLEDEISPALCARMEEHLARCGRCRGACESLRRTLALCRTTPSPEVPEAVQASVRAALRRLISEPT